MASVEVSVTSKPYCLPVRLLLYWRRTLLLLLPLLLLLLLLLLGLPLSMGLLASRYTVLIPQIDRLVVVVGWVSPC